MSRDAAGTPPAPAQDPHEEIPPPVGTLFILMLYVMLIAGMWGAIYLMMLELS